MMYEVIGNYTNCQDIETDKIGRELFEHYSKIVESAQFKNKAILCHASCRPIITCFKCGTTLSENDKFCSNCGSKIKDDGKIEQVKYNIGDKVYYPWRTECRISQNNGMEVQEGEIQGLSIRKGSQGRIIKTVDFKGRNGVLEEHISKNRKDIESFIRTCK